jgi:hypothetical protein
MSRVPIAVEAVDARAATDANPREPALRPAIVPHLFYLLLLLPCLLSAQEAVPVDLAEVENARSRACVHSLGRLSELEAVLEPYALRVDRLNVLGRAVSMEKASDAAPFDATDPLEAEVARWFAEDSAMAVQYLAQPDSALAQDRSRARTAMLERLREVIRELSAEAEGKTQEGASVQEEARPCVGAILVKDVVLEECGADVSPVCQAAREEGPHPAYRFVDDPGDIWDVEQFGPWTTPGPIVRAADGRLAGARTGAQARRGNVIFTVTLAPLLRNRSELSEEEIGEFRANLDSLGFTFDHPQVLMAPAIEFQANLPQPLGGEDLYVLHFGDLSGDDVIWTVDAGSGGLVQAIFPVDGLTLNRLRDGELVSLTAIRTPAEEGEMAEAIFTLSLLQVGQQSNVGTLLEYMGTGALGRDLLALLPPGTGG